MGLMTLADFETDLQSALGDRGILNARLDRWINAGYYDLAGAVEFEILSNDESVNTVNATQTITAPTNTLIIQYIKDTTSDNLLGWVPKGELLRKAITPTGQPLYWSRHKLNIILAPVPDGVYALSIYTLEPPTVLTGTAVTLFPETWDQAVFLLAGHNALLALGDEQRSAAWLGRGITYIQSRMTEQDIQANASGLGASLSGGGMAGLQARLAGLQGGGQ